VSLHNIVGVSVDSPVNNSEAWCPDWQSNLWYVRLVFRMWNLKNISLLVYRWRHCTVSSVL